MIKKLGHLSFVSANLSAEPRKPIFNQIDVVFDRQPTEKEIIIVYKQGSDIGGRKAYPANGHFKVLLICLRFGLLYYSEAAMVFKQLPANFVFYYMPIEPILHIPAKKQCVVRPAKERWFLTKVTHFFAHLFFLAISNFDRY